MSSYSGLSSEGRDRARFYLMRCCAVCMTHKGALHYSEGSDRWWAIQHRIIPVDFRGGYSGQFPRHGDCSATLTWMYWFALHVKFGLRDRVNGRRWRAGYTGTMKDHGRHVSGGYKRGDAIFYGSGSTEHVAMYVGSGNVFSHGSEAGPFICDYNYRPVVTARRYI